jgi:HAD superfamily phosphoserine phosphatase-like hydrolase
VDTFNAKSEAFCKDVVPSLVRPKALEELRSHQASGATVVVISASAENWVKPWCVSNNINCLATQLEVKNNQITGSISGFNCYGAEKEKRIRGCYDLSSFSEIVAYGDSRGDLEMLALANQQHYKPFRI